MIRESPETHLLVVDDHTQSRESVAGALRASGYSVVACASGVEGLAHLRRQPCDLVITDLQMPGMDGLEFIREIERLGLPVEVLMITAHASIGTAVEAMRHGAFDYIEKPFDIERLEQAVMRACAHGQLTTPTRLEHVDDAPVMVGKSEAMQRLRRQIAQVARTDETVLICGESGVGKEMVARSLHAASGRSTGQMVSLNCPVLSEQLTESELFGHRRGAFTGADADRVGRFELAQGGTLLLDEITEIDLSLQAKLLRVLQERTFEPVGASQSIAADVRVLASTNRNLQEEVAKGRFREDLYYRLAVVPIEVPPLRNRREDIPQLALHFLAAANSRLGRPARTLADDAVRLMKNYEWPGNVRELQNVITRACVLTEDVEIAGALIGDWLSSNATSPSTQPHMPQPLGTPVSATLAQVEKNVILATLERHDGHRGQTAAALGIGVRTLSGKLRTYGVAPREKQLQQSG